MYACVAYSLRTARSEIGTARVTLLTGEGGKTGCPPVCWCSATYLVLLRFSFLRYKRQAVAPLRGCLPSNKIIGLGSRPPLGGCYAP